MSYTNAILYYFSGTGNTYRASTWAAERAAELGVDARTVPISRGEPNAEVGVGDEHLVGILTPAHGFTAPWAVILFALLMPRRFGTHAFVVATRGGTKLGRFCLPGMEGTTAYVIALILLMKGFRVRGVLGLDMPTNWIALHPGMSEGNARAIGARAKPRIEAFIGQILTGGKWFRAGGFVCLGLGLLLAQASVGYLVYARLTLAKTLYPNRRCDGCGICAKTCPFNAISMKGWGIPKPFWTYRCESCMRCINFCPRQAIDAAQGWTVFAFYVGHLPLGILVLDQFLSRVFGIHLKLSALPMNIGNYPWFLVALFGMYLALSAFARTPIIDRLLPFLTFTSLYRRYHEPDTKLSELP